MADAPAQNIKRRSLTPSSRLKPMRPRPLPLARFLLLMVPLGVLSACAPLPVDPEAAAQDCEARARAALGPTGSVTLGVNSQTGGYGGASIALSSDYLAGRDPVEVYNQCVWQKTGAAPIRPPRL